MRVGGPQAGGAPGRVLVVDDDAAARQTLVALLDDEFTVEAAGDGGTAATLVDARDFDVVISDYEMPAVSGIELLARVCERRPYVVGLLVTGHADLPAVMVAMHMRGGDRAFDIVAKPYDPEDLIARVRTATRSSRERRATMGLPGA